METKNFSFWKEKLNLNKNYAWQTKYLITKSEENNVRKGKIRVQNIVSEQSSRQIGSGQECKKKLSKSIFKVQMFVCPMINITILKVLPLVKMYTFYADKNRVLGFA